MDAPFRALIKAMERIDEANRTAAIAHDDSHGPGAAAKILDAPHHRRIRNGCRREDAVIAFDQIVNCQNLIDIGNAHIMAPLPFFVRIGNETGLHVAAQAFQGCRRKDSFRRAANTHENVNA